MIADRETVHYVVSRDGTRIGYLQRGAGPGVILVQGAGADARAYRELAAVLATSFTVYSPDRRGRGLSPREFDDAHDIARDVDDLAALVAATGARRMFGLSSGAMLALEAARTLPAIERVAVYEPPFLPGGLPRDGIRRLGAEVERGATAAALATALRITGVAPPLLRILPGTVARALCALVIAIDSLRRDDSARLRDVVPGIRFDVHDVSSRDRQMPLFATVGTPVLLLSGSASPAFLRRGVRDLERVLPNSLRREFSGLDHSAPWNANRGGRPEVIAAALSPFFGTPG